jgi:hypothetical protein
MTALFGPGVSPGGLLPAHIEDLPPRYARLCCAGLDVSLRARAGALRATPPASLGVKADAYWSGPHM